MRQIVAAILNKYYSFTNPFGAEWTIWYLRESYTAILCANLPLTYPLVQRLFKLKNWSHNSYDGHYFSGSRLHRTTRSGIRTGTGPKNHTGMGISKTVSVSVSHIQGREMQRSESEERINKNVGLFDGGLDYSAGKAIEMGELRRKPGSVATQESAKSIEGKV